MKHPQNGVCPVCGAAVQENARFCLHCMTSFDEKTSIPPPAQKNQRVLWAAVLVCALALIGAGIFFVIISASPAAPIREGGSGSETANETDGKTSAESAKEQTQNGENAPLADFDTFRLAVIVTSERLGCDAFWDADGFLDAEYNRETDTKHCTTDLFLSGARLDLFFENGEDVITLVLSDVPKERTADAKRLCAAVHAALINYYSDFYRIITDDGTYHRLDSEEPYIALLTDMTGRTERYAADLAAGTRFSTRYTLIDDENKTDDDLTVFVETKRESAETTLYDLILRFDHYDNEEGIFGGADETE